MKILLTGGCGYVGTPLTQSLLDRGHTVTVVDLQWFGNFLPAHPNLTVICEAPRVGPYRDGMIDSIARIAGIDCDRVSVKATTTEGLGFTGRREGIAAQAIATVEVPRR